jgi:hypothetical protein
LHASENGNLSLAGGTCCQKLGDQRVAVCNTPQSGCHIAVQHADLLLLTDYVVCDW